jgi:hypothetical protein
MSNNLAVRMYPETLRTLAFGGITGTYAGIGSSLINPCRIYWLQNNTDVLLTFSWDGITDHFVLPAGAFVLLDVTSNRTDTGGSLNVASGQRTYVKGAPSVGAVYLTSFFGSNGN